VKEYFNSYWFIDINAIAGEAGGEFFGEVRLIPVVPWDILDTFYSEYHDVQLELKDIGIKMQAIPIGKHEYGRLIVNCQDDKIYALDPESHEYYLVATNLESLIKHMQI